MSVTRLGWNPASAPRGKTLWGVLGFLVPLLAALVLVETRNTTGLPVAALGAGLLCFAALCLFHLETAFLLLLVVTPFSLEIAFAGAGGRLQIPTEPMLFVALAAWGLRFLSRGSARIEEPVLTGGLALGLAACLVSLVDAVHRTNGIKAVLNATWYALYGLFLLNNLDGVRRLKGLAAAILVPGLFVTAASLLRVSLGQYSPSEGLWSFKPWFTEHGTFAAYLSFVFALLLGLAIEMRGRGRPWLWAGTFVVALQIVLSLTRGAWLGMGVLALVLAVFYRRRLLHPRGILVVGAGLAALFWVLSSTGVLTRLTTYTETTSTVGYTSNFERVNRWGAGWRMFQSDPWTGVGFGTYPDLYMGYRSFTLGTEQSSLRMGIHSEYFKIPVETGVIGTLIALVVLVCVWRMGALAIREARTPFLRGLAVGLAGGLLTYMVHGWVNNYLMFDKVAIPVWTSVAGLGAILRFNRRAADDRIAQGSVEG